MDKLRYYLEWWFNYKLPDFIEREITEPFFVRKKINVLTGARRSGKSTLVYQLITQLRKSIPKENIIFINLEDDRLHPMKGDELKNILEIYKQFYKPVENHPLWLFVDEIQEIPGWEKTIRRFYEIENINIVLTGSNANLLSSQIHTSLRGRAITNYVSPLNFKEFLKFKDYDYENITNFKYTSEVSAILNYFNEYLIFGGFPETALQNGIEEKKKILASYLDTIFFADIIERNKIRNVKLLENLMRMLLRQISSPLSVNKMTNTLKSIGFKSTALTVNEYLRFYEEAFLFRYNSFFSYNMKNRIQTAKKLYTLDNGLYSVTSFKPENDFGLLLENLVYNTLSKKYKDIFYWKGNNNYEVDFIIPENFNEDDRYSLIQVCSDISNEKTLSRETRALIKAADEFNQKKALILTHSQFKKISAEKLTIDVVPFYYWQLSKE